MGTQIPIGTTKTLFAREYVYTDPQYIRGLGLWRDTNLPPAPIEISTIDAILPIVSTQYDQGREVNLTFEINELPTITGAKGATTLIAAQRKLNIDSPYAPQAPEITSLKTVIPVKSTTKQNASVLYFDISALSYLELDAVGSPIYIRRMKARANSYNSRRGAGPSLTATAPMVEDTVGSSATVSFDITDLNYV